jgi:hypothetical protein
MVFNQKEYRKNHKEEIKKYKKRWYQKNKERIRKERDNNRKEINEKAKEYRKRERNKTRMRQKKYWEKNKGYYRQKSKENYNKNKEEIKKYKKEWKKKNPEYHKNYDKKYLANKYKTDKEFKISVNLRSALTRALKLYTKTGKVMSSKKYGINYKKIVEHLKPFPKDLTNYQIHHIKPLHTFNFINKDGSTNLKEIKKAFMPKNHKWVTKKEHREIHNQLNQIQTKMKASKK